MSHTLWLVPTDSDEERLRSMIERFAGELGTVIFAPHVTLVSGLEAVVEPGRLGSLSGTSQITLPVTGVSTSDAFFRCVAIELEPRGELLTLREAAESAFGIKPSAGYRPHVSLVYGRLPGSVRERIRSEASASLPPSISFDRLDLVSTSDPVEQWETVVRSPLRFPL